MKFSVALCSYNGERFLAEQLASIREQSRLPDELVICDDASTDRSAAIAQQFAARAPFPVLVKVNEKNLGSTLNFSQAIRLCTGDLIALADQDDIWLPHKLAALESALAKNPEAGFAFSNAEVVDDGLKALGYTLWEAIEFQEAEQERFRNGGAFEVLLRRYRVTGATMAFRGSYGRHINPIPPEWLHDAWIALLVSSLSSCCVVAEPLIRYRQHASQQCGGLKRGLHKQYLTAKTCPREAFEKIARCYSSAQERLNRLPGMRSDRRALLAEKLAHCRQRMTMRYDQQWRFPHVLREIWKGNYRRFSAGWKAIAQDMLLR